MPHKDKQTRKEYKTWWNKQYYQTHKAEERDRIRQRKLKLREWFKQYKSQIVCSKCGEKHIACLEFHHEAGQNKDIGIAAAVGVGCYSPRRILHEISKCIVLCANCHRKLHYH